MFFNYFLLFYDKILRIRANAIFAKTKRMITLTNPLLLFRRCPFAKSLTIFGQIVRGNVNI